MTDETQAAEQKSDSDGQEILRDLRDKVFGGSDENLALAMGRPVAEIKNFINGTEKMDEDAEMKARGLAEERTPEADA